MNRTIILCGLPKSGKTIVGEALAKWLDLKFIDTDRSIERACASRSCREIFLQEGEAYFRAVERQQIAALANTADTVISLGGGALQSCEIEQLVRSLGSVVYLSFPVAQAWERLLVHGLPAYLRNLVEFTQLAQERIPVYERTAHITIEVGELTIPQTVDQIVQCLEAAHGE